MTESNENPVLRRMRIRRGRSFAGGLSHSTTGHGGREAEDPVEEELREADTAVLEDLQARAQARQPRTGVSMESGEPVESDEEFTPMRRLDTVRRRSSNYEREYRLRLLHRMLLRGVPLDEIAEQFQLSVSQVQRDRTELYSRLREAAREMDINQIVGDHTGFYKEVAGMALRASSKGTLPMAIRLSAMRTALAANADLHRFYQACGVYDTVRYRKSAEATDSDISRMMAMTKAILQGEDAPEEAVEDASEELFLLG